MGRLAKTRGRLLTTGEIAAKVQWEGGVGDAMNYGLDPSDFQDRELALLWSQTRMGLDKIDKILEPFYDQGEEG